MGCLFRSEEMCLVQLFLQAGSAYNCVSELGELGLVEFRDLNPNVNAFQRKFVSEVRRCEELEKTFKYLEQEISRSICPPLKGPLPTATPIPSAPQPRELLSIEEESERLARELREVRGERRRSRLNEYLLFQKGYHVVQVVILTQFACRYQGTGTVYVTIEIVFSHFSCEQVCNKTLIMLLTSFLHSFVTGVVHPWKVPAFERLLWRACRGYIIVDFWEMGERLEAPDTGEMIKWTVFVISFWGEQIGQKVKKICDCFHTHTFVYPEGLEEREGILQGKHVFNYTLVCLQVLSQTEQYMQQLLSRCVCQMPQWKIRVRKCKAVQMVLNLCSPSVTEKCLIAEAWCPVAKLSLLQSALIEGTGKSGSSVDSFYNRLPAPTSPPTLFNTNTFTSSFQNIVDAYGVASYREVNPAVYTIITFPFLFAVMFGDVGHGLLMTLAALWMILEERDPKMRNNTNEIWRMLFGGRYLILLMGLFSIYTGAVYNECFSKGLSPLSSGWHLKPMMQHYNWSDETLRSNQYLTLDPNVTGVFQGPYLFGIDPIWSLANNHLTFLNSYKMKMSVIIGVIHMTFGVCLSFFNYIMFLVLIPELVFMLCLFGYLVFMVVFKWIAFGPQDSDRAPSILIHFIDMFVFAENPDNPPLYPGQMIVQRVLVCLALLAVPVLLLGRPLFLYFRHRNNRRTVSRGEIRLASLLKNMKNIFCKKCLMLTKAEFDCTEVFMHQAIHTIEYCLGCISNTASYLRLWALSLAHAQLSEVLWVMVMRISLSWQGYVGSVVVSVIFSVFAMLTVSILLVMEGLSAFLHALRLHWVEFQNKFYSGSGYKFNPFSFASIQHLQ
uniref:V-type proton ATPase subunit a n=1 Tax=Sinocyclocheilus grahami TaxID=75366 RepID=A0A672QHH9_SINGR